MRAKNILWILLIAILLGPTMINLGFAPVADTKIVVEPDLVTGLLPGDKFWVNINIINAIDVSAFQFKLGFQPAASIIVALEPVEDGGFLGPAIFVGTVFLLDGYVHVGGAAHGDAVSGDGTLARIQFAVVEAGECPLELFDTMLLNPDRNELPHQTIDGYYLGPTADLYTVPGANSTRVGQRGWKVGDTKKFKAIAENTGYAPLWVRAKYTTVRDDGAVFTLYSGQHLWTTQARETEYYYVNGYTPSATRPSTWRLIGSSPYLDAIEDGNYVQGDLYCQTVRYFDFQDITLGIGDVIGSVTLEGYTKSDNVDIDFDVYVYIGGSYAGWAGSLWGTDEFGWHKVRWVTPITSDIIPALKTEAGFNSVQMMIHYWTPEGGTLGNATLDALRLKVEFTGLEGNPHMGSRRVDPDEVIALPHAEWDLYGFDVGTYVTTVEIQYLYATPSPSGQYWQTGETALTYTWSVRP